MEKLIISSLVLALSFFSGPSFANDWFSQEDMVLFYEAITKIRSHSLEPRSAPKTIEEMLRAYVQNIDEYADYLTSKEYTAYQRSTAMKYSGVAMDLRSEDRGHIFLYPIEGGVAANSGIKQGDELVAVNGFPVFGKSIYVVGTEIQGKNGTWVQLTIRTNEDVHRTVSIKRHETAFNPIAGKSLNRAFYIKLSRFTKDTPELLRDVIRRVKVAQTIVFDLRNNAGGSLPAAGKSADLFLEPGLVIYQLSTRNGLREFISKLSPVANNPIIILQDQKTASAAEVFIAALVQNGRATSAGEKSFGKAQAQRFFELLDGSALLLTYGEIITPDKKTYQGKGLTPNFSLKGKIAQGDFSKPIYIHHLLERARPGFNNNKLEGQQ